MSAEALAISEAQVLDRLIGGNRTDEQIAKDGARVTISQIEKLRRQLDQLERCAQHVNTTGKARHDDAAVWKRVRKLADKLLDGMA